MNNVTTTLSDEQITKIKIMDLNKSYDFYIHEYSKEKFEVVMFFEIQNLNR
jgi:hypothetical protein